MGISPSGRANNLDTGGQRTRRDRVIAPFRRRFFLGELFKKLLLLGTEADHHLANALGFPLVLNGLVDRMVLGEELRVRLNERGQVVLTGTLGHDMRHAVHILLSQGVDPKGSGIIGRHHVCEVGANT